MFKPDEGPNAALHDELHEADLGVEGVLPQVVLAEELRIVRPRHGQRVLCALEDVRVVQEVEAAAHVLAQLGNLHCGWILLACFNRVF